MVEETNTRRRPRLGRSPAYPGIGLKLAVERVKQVRIALGNHPAHVDAVIDSWGLSPNGSIARLTVAALRYFGLLEFEGRGEDRKAKVSELALDILLREEGSRDWFNAIQEAALKPTIHKAIWEEYNGNLPEADRPLALELIRNRAFNDNSVGDFIRQFRGTLEFAQLTRSYDVSDEDSDRTASSEYQSGVVTLDHDTRTTGDHVKVDPAHDLRSLPLPISTGVWPTIQIPYPMTEGAWKEMIAVLKAMKGGIVTPSASALGSGQTSPSDDDSQPTSDSEVGVNDL